MYEKTIQELAEREPRQVFPGRGFTVVGRQVPVTGGIIDLLMEDANGLLWVVELKRDRLTAKDVGQVHRYGPEIRKRYPGRGVALLLAGPEASKRTLMAATALRVDIHMLDMARLADLAARHGVVDGLARPVRRGTPQRPSRPRGPGSTRKPNSQRLEHQAALDAAFPPGSITAQRGLDLLPQYWRAASPTASLAARRLAVELSEGVLMRLAGCALSNRASAWTCFRRADGLVVASMEPKTAVCHFSVMVPDDLAQDLERRGLAKIHQVRNGGAWVNTRCVGERADVRAALTWYEAGLAVLGH